MALRVIRRVLRGASRQAIDDAVALLPGPVRLETPEGRVLFGDGSGGEAHPVLVDGQEVAVVHGGEGSASLAGLIGVLVGHEAERRSLADETLGRYKELSLLYDMSDKLSRVLDLEDVADLIVNEAQRFLRTDGATLFLLDSRGRTLESVAGTGEQHAAPSSLDAEQSLERLVVESGNAEFIEDVLATDPVPGVGEGVRSVMCAPLRSGEDVIGVLRLANHRPTAWTAGDLKLVAALAANSASAVTRALLHGDQLRQQALRSQIERFVSPNLARAALEDIGGAGVETVTVLFCDLTRLAHGTSADTSAVGVLSVLEAAACASMDVLMGCGATVNFVRGEMLVALFVDPDGFEAGARRAVEAATAVMRTFDRDAGPSALTRPGIGLARGHDTLDDEEGILAGIGVAAAMQLAAEGVVLVDSEVASAVEDTVSCTPGAVLDLETGATPSFEVHE